MMNNLFISVLLSLLFFVGIQGENDVEIKNLKLFVDGTEYFLKTVCYNPAPLGKQDMNPDETGGTGLCSVRHTPFPNEYKSACFDSDFFDGSPGAPGRVPPGPGGDDGKWFADVWERDFQEIVAIGFNSIRMYNMQPATREATIRQTELYAFPYGKSHIEFMNAAHRYGLKVIFPLFGDKTALLQKSEEDLKRLVMNQIDEIGNHPALVMYTFGNELNVFYETEEFIALLNRMYRFIRGYQLAKWNRFIPVTTACIDFPGSYETLSRILEVDVFTTNAGYRGLTYSNLWSGGDTQDYTFSGWYNLSCTYNKPVFIGEYGAHSDDNWRDNKNWFTSNFEDLMNHVDQGCIGGAFFEWNDEPLKAANQQEMGLVVFTESPDSREPNGWTPDILNRKFNNGAYSWDVVNGTNGEAINLHTDVFEFLGRQPYTTSNPGPDICAPFGGLKENNNGIDNNIPKYEKTYNPVIYYKMDGLNGNELTDSSGNNNHATVGGNPTFTTGIRDDSISLTRFPDGTDKGDQFINAGVSTLARRLSVLVWIKITDSNLNNYMKIASTKENYNDQKGWELEYNPALNRLVFIGAGDKVVSYTVDLNEDWHHIAVTVNHQYARLFVDGHQITGYRETIIPIQANDQRELLIGSNSKNPGAGGAFTGEMDELRIYDDFLIPEEVERIYKLDSQNQENPITGFPDPTTKAPSNPTQPPTNPTEDPLNTEDPNEKIEDSGASKNFVTITFVLVNVFLFFI